MIPQHILALAMQKKVQLKTEIENKQKKEQLEEDIKELRNEQLEIKISMNNIEKYLEDMLKHSKGLTELKSMI